MNPVSLIEALKIFNGIKVVARRTKQVQTIICPPILYLTEIRKNYRLVGAQDVSFQVKGSHTGEISAEMLKKSGAEYVIIGHSERRAMGETNETVNKKIQIALDQNLKIILCIGESKRDEDGEYLHFIRIQLRQSLKNIGRRFLKNIFIAYEPLFTIGQKNFEAMSSHDVHQMVIFIRKNLIEHFADKLASRVPILYGGSVSAVNAKEIVDGGEVDGLLIGRQSLNPEQFTQIIKSIK